MRAAPVQRTILSTRRILVPPLTLCSYMKKGPNLRWSLIQCSGGDEGNRTPDLLTASQALSQLSYAPVRRVLYGNSDGDARTILEKLSRAPLWTACPGPVATLPVPPASKLCRFTTMNPGCATTLDFLRNCQAFYLQFFKQQIWRARRSSIHRSKPAEF